MAISTITRRIFLKGTLAAAFAGGMLKGRLPQFGETGLKTAKGKESKTEIYYHLKIRRRPCLINGQIGLPITINDCFPGPLIRLKEGKNAIIKVTNQLPESTSVHWHGILLPYQMDGVPGVVFPGISSGESFTYSFPVKQSGTYWYHSHTGLQEQLGHYGPLICEPAHKVTYDYDREHVIVLSDWTFEEPEAVLMHLKKWEGYYNYHKRTVKDLFSDISHKGLLTTLRTRAMWAKMRMSPRDIADVTGATYTYLINGAGPLENQPFIFRPGERIRLRVINASAATYFDFSIPGLEMTVVQADGQDVSPVKVDEFRISVAETYDVLVTPSEQKAYPILAKAMDRSGYALASLTFSKDVKASVPQIGPPLERGMEAMDMPSAGMKGMKMKGVHDNKKNPCGDCQPESHNSYPFGPDAAMIVTRPRCMVDSAGIGFSKTKKVLSYADLSAIEPYDNHKSADKILEIHLTGNMERFIWKMWAWDGKRWSSKFHDLVDFPLGKRIKIIFVNHTMMDHPIHLHGMWMRVQNGKGNLCPRKHTVNIKPAEKLCVEVDADAFGNWAFHCHILYHMHTGMFRVVRSC